MDAGVRQKRVEALEKIKDERTRSVQKGVLTPLKYVILLPKPKKNWLIQLPDEEAFKKAVRATQAYKGSREG
jgi:hypothetical protein